MTASEIKEALRRWDDKFPTTSFKLGPGDDLGPIGWYLGLEEREGRLEWSVCCGDWGDEAVDFRFDPATGEVEARVNGFAASANLGADWTMEVTLDFQVDTFGGDVNLHTCDDHFMLCLEFANGTDAVKFESDFMVVIGRGGRDDIDVFIGNVLLPYQRNGSLDFLKEEGDGV